MLEMQNLRLHPDQLNQHGQMSMTPRWISNMGTSWEAVFSVFSWSLLPVSLNLLFSIWEVLGLRVPFT
jgi:hypothetical protein